MRSFYCVNFDKFLTVRANCESGGEQASPTTCPLRCSDHLSQSGVRLNLRHSDTSHRHLLDEF